MKFECEASSPVTTSPQTASPSLQDEILRDILKEMKTMRTEMKEIRAEVDQIKPDFQIFDSIPHVDKCYVIKLYFFHITLSHMTHMI